MNLTPSLTVGLLPRMMWLAKTELPATFVRAVRNIRSSLL
jgi:hypothetical protein